MTRTFLNANYSYFTVIVLDKVTGDYDLARGLHRVLWLFHQHKLASQYLQ